MSSAAYSALQNWDFKVFQSDEAEMGSVTWPYYRYLGNYLWQPDELSLRYASERIGEYGGVLQEKSEHVLSALMSAHSPTEIHALFQNAFNLRDIETLVSLYEPD